VLDNSSFVSISNLTKAQSLTPCPFPNSIPDDEIQLWCVMDEDIEDADFVHQNEAHLSDSERERAGRFYRQRDRNCFVIGRGIMRRALGAYYSIEPRDAPILQNRYGCPEISISVPKPIRFNVSHTDGIVAIAFATRRKLGVDVERICLDFSYLEVAQRQFPRSAWADLEGLREPLRRVRFYEYWVLLEAYAKSTGKGLFLPLGDIAFEFDKVDQSIIHFKATNVISEHRQFWLTGPSPDCRLAIAASGEEGRLVVRRLRPQLAETVHLPVLASGKKQEPFRLRRCMTL